ncbi:hypothetical protein J2W69_003651 [Rheinheimera soli]|uniref:Uncharacterized protein n=1 Tax=Rheinheimera soli TaxID=443616 RepID=A0ABU1W3W7_9GAMM|nr:hypothetical protein [Rheinheimera soli]
MPLTQIFLHSQFLRCIFHIFLLFFPILFYVKHNSLQICTLIGL